MKVLALDCGNTRLKWGFHDGAAWTHIGALGYDELDELAAALAALPAPERVAVANVAGTGARAALETQLAHPGWPGAKPRWLASAAAQCGVTNGYADPGKLGVDRWCALIGARHLQPGAVIVVGAGTATTVDMLSAHGEFLGGLILPGVDLMKRSLAENTAALPLMPGSYVDEPHNTVDAIESGILHAQAGAIERMAARLAARAQGLEAGFAVSCLVSGGAAPHIVQALTIPHRVVDHLVLEGALRVAQAGG